jgi:hypothetical protein
MHTQARGAGDDLMTGADAEGEGVVVALRFDEVAVAADLAEWCEGTVVTDDPLDPASLPVAVRVPTSHGSMLAERGDWIVRGADGTFTTMRHTEFVARHEPLA